MSLEDEIAALEAQTGLDVGYHRCGRLIPLPKPHLVDIALGHQLDAATHWQSGGRSFAWNVIARPMEAGWPAVEDEASLAQDTFAARVSPRALTAALRRAVEQSRHVRLVEGCRCPLISIRARGVATLSDGGTVVFGHCTRRGRDINRYRSCRRLARRFSVRSGRRSRGRRRG